jgi:DNA-binding NtrC family response regulator
MTGDKPTALIVDDELIIRELLRQTLQEQGYACEVAASGEEALVRLKKREFDVALLDIRMPGMSGMDLLVSIAHSNTKTRVIMVTAVSDVKTGVEAMKKGAVDYIVKPFSIDDVRTRVSEALETRNSEARRSAVGSDNGKTSPLHRQMDAIAHGVEARVERFDFHSRIVTEETIEVARQLGLPEQDIEEWASSRLKSRVDRDRRIQHTIGGPDRRTRLPVSS